MEEEDFEKTGRLARIEAKLDRLENGKNKKKKFRVPARGKVSTSKMKKGYVTVVVIEDNKNIDFVKEPIVDGTIKLGGDTFHAIDSKDVFYYKGKPLIIQPKRTLNPYNPLKTEHQTYGQKYIMARMEGDKIVSKKKVGVGLIIGIVAVIAIIAYALLGG